MKITIFGTGYVGLVTGACLANVGHEILCVDIDAEKIERLKKGEITFFEPGLQELVLRNKERGRIFFSTNVEEGVNFGEVIFNCVGTPSKNDGSADLSAVFSVAESVGKYAKEYKVLVNKSTVPPGTARRCHDIILSINPSSEAEVVSNPEFLAEGKAVHDFTHPDKIVIGAKSEKPFHYLKKAYTGRVRTYIPTLETDWETAEMIKYANNSFLATKISFINEIANICDKVGADVKLVAQAMGLDYRINPRFLNPGVGYGGSCFPKDVRALIHTARERGYEPRFLDEVNSLNERQKKLLQQKVQDFFGTITGKTFTVWGASFKPKTSDVREAPALVLIKDLLEQGAKVNVYDPIALHEAKQALKANDPNLRFSNSVVDSVKGSSGIFLVTEWDEFRAVNFAELGKEMLEKVLFDGRNIYEPELVREEGFEYFGVGRR